MQPGLVANNTLDLPTDLLKSQDPKARQSRRSRESNILCEAKTGMIQPVESVRTRCLADSRICHMQ